MGEESPELQGEGELIGLVDNRAVQLRREEPEPLGDDTLNAVVYGHDVLADRLEGTGDVPHVGLGGVVEKAVEGHLIIPGLVPAQLRHEQRVLGYSPRSVGVPREPVGAGQGVGDVTQVHVLRLRIHERELPPTPRNNVWFSAHLLSLLLSPAHRTLDRRGGRVPRRSRR